MGNATIDETLVGAADFAYVNLAEIDPNFSPIDEGVYNLRIGKAELRTYTAKTDTKTKKAGETGSYINFTFIVTGGAKFNGRRHFESLFPSEFTMKVLRRIMDATGIAQTSDIPAWLAELSSVNPTVKLKVAVVPDLNRDGTPNQKSVRPDGSAGVKNEIDWKFGVQAGD